MLAESVIEWTEQWKQLGRQEGRLEGKLEGRLEGKLEGKLEGRLEGKLEGESAMLERLLIKRFGVLPEAVRSRLRNATLEQIETWAERVLEAKTLDDVLGAP